MAAGDMGWSDCGRKSLSQFFYGKKQGRKQVGRCGQYETRTALYANRLHGRWKRLFKMKFDREPSGEELWAALRTGEIAENVRDWEKEPLREEKNPPKSPHIHRGSGGRRMTVILAEYIAREQVIKEDAIMARLQEEEADRIRQIKSIARVKICQSSEIPRRILSRLANNEIKSRDVCTLFGVDDQRIEILIEAFGLKD